MSTEQNPPKPTASAEATTPLTLDTAGTGVEHGAEALPETPEALYLLGKGYYTGSEGTPPDHKQAVIYIEKAANLGLANAQFQMAGFYFQGKEVNKDSEQAVAWLQKAANQNHFPAQFQLSACYFQGSGVPQDNSQGVFWLKKAAEQNFPPAQCDLGVIFSQGMGGVARDAEQAIALFQAAAAQNYSPAQTNLGICYLNGAGVPPDAKKAVALLEEAAKNNKYAKYELGKCYLMGKEVAQDIPRALKLLEEAARLQLSQAYYCLGIYYLKASGAAQNPKHGVKLLHHAAQQGYAPAQYALGMCFFNGEGLSTEDTERGIQCFKLASQPRPPNNPIIHTSPLDPSEAEVALRNFDDPAEKADDKQEPSSADKIETLEWAIARIAYLCKSEKEDITRDDFADVALMSPLNPYVLLKDKFFKKTLKKISPHRAKLLEEQINTYKDTVALEPSIKSKLLAIFQNPKSATQVTIAPPKTFFKECDIFVSSDTPGKKTLYNWFKSSLVKHAAQMYPSATQPEQHFQAAKLTVKPPVEPEFERMPFFTYASFQQDVSSVLYIYKKTTKEKFQDLVRLQYSLDRPKYQALYTAARDNCEKLVALFLTVLPPEEANTYDDSASLTPLQFAIKHNAHKAVAAYVQRYAQQSDVMLKPNKKHHGNNSLHMAIKEGNMVAFRLLLSVLSSSHLRAKNDHGEDALELAIKLDQHTMAELLVDKMTSEDLGQVNAAGATQFHKLVNLPHTPQEVHDAAKYKHTLEIIVKKSTPHLNTAETQRGFTPLHTSIQNGNIYLTELLLAQSDIEINTKTKDQNRFTPLHLAAHHGNIDAAKALLKKQSLNINAQASSGRTPMHCVIASEQIVSERTRLQLIEALLIHKADIASKSTKGFTPLHLAVAHKHTACAQLLLSHLTDEQANEASYEGGTALHLAVAAKNTAVVDVLLSSKKMDINATYKGYTSLHGAAAMGNLEMVTKLLECKADPLVKDRAENTPFQLALAGKMTEQRQKVIDLLKKYQPETLASAAATADFSAEGSTSTAQHVTTKLRKPKMRSFLSAWDDLLSQCEEENTPAREDVHRDLRDSHLSRAKRYAIPEDLKLIPSTASARVATSSKPEDNHYYPITRHTMTSDNPVFIHVTDDVIRKIGGLWPLVKNRLKSDPPFLDACNKKQGIKPIVKGGGTYEFSLRGHAEGISDIRPCGKFQECTDVPGYEGQKVLVLVLIFDKLLTHTGVERLPSAAPSGPAAMFASSAAASTASVSSAEAARYSPPQ